MTNDAITEMQSQLRCISHSLGMQITRRNKGITDALFTISMLREMLQGDVDPARCIRVLDTAISELQKARHDDD